VMIMHAFLVLGTPKSSLHWIAYFKSFSYQCSDDVFSLAELEHCVIRKSMSSPSQVFLSKFTIPTKSTYNFGLTKGDVRLNFALNCGSTSNPKYVPVFKVESLNEELDRISRLYLSLSVTLSRRDNVSADIYLPRICQWFAKDFGSDTAALLATIQPFIDSDVKNYLDAYSQREDNKFNISVKYKPFSLKCRKLTLSKSYPERIKVRLLGAGDFP